MPKIVHNKIGLTYDDAGQGEPAFVFVHGWTCNKSFFSHQAEYFSKKHRVVSIDLRGHGESDRPEEDYPISGYADDVAYVIKELDIGPVVAVGHSMGGLVVLELAAAYPDSVAAIAMIDPAPFAPSDERRKSVEMLIASIESGETESLHQMIASRYFLPTSSRAILNEVRKVMMSTPAHVTVAALRGLVQYDGVASAKKVNVPALHLAATPPLNPPHLVSEWLPGVINGWTVGAGHFSQLEVPGQVNAMIEAFFEHYVKQQAAG